MGLSRDVYLAQEVGGEVLVDAQVSPLLSKTGKSGSRGGDPGNGRSQAAASKLEHDGGCIWRIAIGDFRRSEKGWRALSSEWNRRGDGPNKRKALSWKKGPEKGKQGPRSPRKVRCDAIGGFTEKRSQPSPAENHRCLARGNSRCRLAVSRPEQSFDRSEAAVLCPQLRTLNRPHRTTRTQLGPLFFNRQVEHQFLEPFKRKLFSYDAPKSFHDASIQSKC